MSQTHAKILIALALAGAASAAHADPSYERALRRTQYLLNGTVPSDADYARDAADPTAYKSAVRRFLDAPNFYDAAMRYHELVFGTGLQDTYLDELQKNDIDNKENKIAKISCNRDDSSPDHRYRCFWAIPPGQASNADGSCPQAWEQPVTAFWYPGVVAWVCPSIVNACGSDLSRCYIEYQNANDAKNAELGATEIFDTRFAVVKSLSKQAAGLATAVVVNNYPYTKILEPGLTAVDGAITHLFHLDHQFDVSKLNAPAALTDMIDQISLTDSHYVLVNPGPAYEQGGVISTYGWLRRYEKDRTRANQLYNRLLCRQFTAQLPRVFPADPGNLRTTPGCMGCHATLDPLADFFKEWGEGGNLYAGQAQSVPTSFDNHDGQYVSDLATIISHDDAFATCTVQHVWEWLMGRGFYRDEADLRAALTKYFVTTQFSFKELVFAMTTHPGFIEGSRADATIGDPLAEPPLGQPPGGDPNQPCPANVDFTADIQPATSMCTKCHVAGTQSSPVDLTTQAQWQKMGADAVSIMASGNMPPGQAGPPLLGPVFDLKEKVRCWLGQPK